MALKVEGVLAKPGPYKHNDQIEYKTAEDLKVIARDQPLIDITLGHPPNRMVEKKYFLGSVKPTWNEEKQALIGDFWFKDEHLHKIPPEILEKLKKRYPVGISLAYMFEKEGDILKNMHLNHVALLQNEEGTCPLKDCGVNVRLESEEANYRYEQEQTIGEEPKPAEKETVESPADREAEVPKELTADLLREIIRSEISKALSPPKPAEPEPVVEEKKEETAPEPVEEPISPEPEPQTEPEHRIPRDVSASKKEAGVVVLTDDVAVISTPLGSAIPEKQEEK